MPTGGSWWRHILCGVRLCVGMYVRSRFGDTRRNQPNYSTLWPAGPALSTFVGYLFYLVALCSLPETASDVISCRSLKTMTDLLVNCSQPGYRDVVASRWSYSFYTGNRNPWVDYWMALSPTTGSPSRYPIITMSSKSHPFKFRSHSRRKTN